MNESTVWSWIDAISANSNWETVNIWGANRPIRHKLLMLQIPYLHHYIHRAQSIGGESTRIQREPMRTHEPRSTVLILIGCWRYNSLRFNKWGKSTDIYIYRAASLLPSRNRQISCKNASMMALKMSLVFSRYIFMYVKIFRRLTWVNHMTNHNQSGNQRN